MKDAITRWIRRHSLTAPIFPVIFLAAVGVYGYLNNFEFPMIYRIVDYFSIGGTQSRSGTDAAGIGFACDGRTTCPQMTSCDEAKYFLKNCPTENMDGDLDGVPCESDWCRR